MYKLSHLYLYFKFIIYLFQVVYIFTQCIIYNRLNYSMTSNHLNASIKVNHFAWPQTYKNSFTEATQTSMKEFLYSI